MRRLISRFLGDISGEMLKSTAKAIAVTSVFSAGTAWYVAEKTEHDRSGLSALVSTIAGERGSAGVDATTTASIRNQSVKLDPCAVPRKP